MNSMHQGIGMTSQRTRNRLVERLRSSGISDERVLSAIASTPRHIFVDEALASRAYEDTALPIGNGQTISQPYIVARMTEAVIAGGEVDKVLEIGTGCGYQTAILSQVVGTVYSVERIRALVDQARERLFDLRINNVRLKYADGNLGWAENAPYDAIIVTAAPASVPEVLFEQLSPGGRLVIPVGEAGQQKLMMYQPTADGVEETMLDWVSFVPMLGGTG